MFTSVTTDLLLHCFYFYDPIIILTKKYKISNFFLHLFYYRSLLKAAVIIIPLLGCTWVFGLLAVNEETVVFAWLFTVTNSLQVGKMMCQFYYCEYIFYIGIHYLGSLCTEEWKGKWMNSYAYCKSIIHALKFQCIIILKLTTFFDRKKFVKLDEFRVFFIFVDAASDKFFFAKFPWFMHGTSTLKIFNYSRDYSRFKKILKQAGVVHDIKSQ